MAMDPEFPDRPHTTSETSWSSLYKKSLPGRCPARVRNFTAIFIDDIDDAIPANLRDRDRVCKYADDCTFYESISTNDESSLQVVLNSIHEWTTSNHMQINMQQEDKGHVYWRLESHLLFLIVFILENVNLNESRVLNCWESGFRTISVGIITLRRWLRRPTEGYSSCVNVGKPIFLKTLELHFTTQRSALYYSTRHLSGEVYPTICLKKSNEFKTVAVVLLVYQELLHERRSTATKRELGKILKDESNTNNVFVKS